MTPTQTQRLRYIVSDYLMANIGWLTFNIVRFYSLPMGYAVSLPNWLCSHGTLLGQVVFPLMMVILWGISGYYNRPFFKSRMDELLNTVIVVFISMLIIFFAVLINDEIPERLRNYEMMLIMWLCLTMPTYIARLCITQSTIKRVRCGKISSPTLLVGTREQERAIASQLTRASSALRIVGSIDATDADSVFAEAKRLGATGLIICQLHNDITATTSLINALYAGGLSIHVTPDLFHSIMMRPRLSSVAAEPVIDITTANISDATLNLKRLGDIAVSSVALILLLPLTAILAVLIKKDSAGPVFYRQERVGYHKKTFFIYKFRTMRTDAEAAGPQLTANDDPRVTRIGRTLRKYRIDELPQFFNVLRGDMSIVGPRPERQYYTEQILKRAPYYCLIHQVRPGITSWGMVKFGYASTIDEMLQRVTYDLVYLENVSLGVDLKILFHTVSTVLSGKGK